MRVRATALVLEIQFLTAMEKKERDPSNQKRLDRLFLSLPPTSQLPAATTASGCRAAAAAAPLLLPPHAFCHCSYVRYVVSAFRFLVGKKEFIYAKRLQL